MVKFTQEIFIPDASKLFLQTVKREYCKQRQFISSELKKEREARGHRDVVSLCNVQSFMSKCQEEQYPDSYPREEKLVGIIWPHYENIESGECCDGLDV